jgi:hypothetical protein
MHKHKAITSSWQTRPWVHCVTPEECAAMPHWQRAHGNITVTDRCRCGAWRDSEINGGKVNYGPWREIEGKEG